MQREVKQDSKRETKKSEIGRLSDGNKKTDEKLNKNIIGKTGKWTAIRANPNSNNVCYAILYANDRKGNQKLAQEKPYIMIHYFAEGRVRFSAYFGYSLLEYRDVHVSIDSMQYKLKPMNEYAITDSSEKDDAIVEALRGAKNLMIRGEGANYSYSIDFYDVSGTSEVFKILQTQCDSTTNNSSFKGIVPTKKDLKKL